MRRPYRRRRVELPPRYRSFKPAGVPRRALERVHLTVDEYEAVRLADHEGYEHLAASQRMGISRSTFTRLIAAARGKVAEALIDGKEILVEGGNVDFIETLHRCRECGEMRRRPARKRTERCPDCGSRNVEDLAHESERGSVRREGRQR